MEATRSGCGRASQATHGGKGARVSLEGTTAYWRDQLVLVNTVKGNRAWVTLAGEEVGSDEFMVETTELRPA
jgi:hypothetical protein